MVLNVSPDIMGVLLCPFGFCLIVVPDMIMAVGNKLLNVLGWSSHELVKLMYPIMPAKLGCCWASCIICSTVSLNHVQLASCAVVGWRCELQIFHCAATCCQVRYITVVINWWPLIGGSCWLMALIIAASNNHKDLFPPNLLLLAAMCWVLLAVVGGWIVYHSGLDSLYNMILYCLL